MWPRPATGSRVWWVAILFLGSVAVGNSLAHADLAGIGGAPPAGETSELARRDIPGRYLRHYQRARRCPGLSWQVLAAIGKVESDHGRVAGARRGGSSSAGALGPMQFLPGTWPAYGRGDVYDPADAIPAAARYLCANGMPDTRRAVFAYNHGPAAAYQAGDGYTGNVMAWSRRYTTGGF